MALPLVTQPETLTKLLGSFDNAITAMQFYQLKPVPGGFKNLTPYTVAPCMEALLSYGPKFMCPTSVDVVDVVEDFGRLYNHLQRLYGILDPTQIFLELFHNHRREVEDMFKNRPLSVVENAIRLAMAETNTFFQSHPDACIVQSDKGNTTCLMLVEDYQAKMKAYVDKSLREGVYVVSDDTNLRVAISSFIRIRDDLKKVLNVYPWASRIPRELYDRIATTRVCTSTLPMLYGMVKCHKEGAPMRPICSTLRWLSRPIQKLLLWILKDYFGARLCAENVRRIDEVARDIANLRTRPGYVFIKFDITNMYGSIDKEKIGRMLVAFLSSDEIAKKSVLSSALILRLFHYSMYLSCLVNYEGKTYKQAKGLPQGACDSGFLATLYLDTIFQVHNEELFLAHKVCRFWKYMDDLLLYMPVKYVPHFKRTFERITGLVLELEMQEEVTSGVLYGMGVRQTISFLDISISTLANGTLCTSEYRKPTASARMLNALSTTLVQYKINTLKAFLQKILRRTSTDLLAVDYFDLYERALDNGYPDSLIQHLFQAVLAKERAALASGHCFLPLNKEQMQMRVSMLTLLANDTNCGNSESVQEIRNQSLAISPRSRVVFPYRSISLSRLLCLGCSYGGLPAPVYSRSQQNGFMARFFANERLKAVVQVVSSVRCIFNVGLLRCTQCDMVFVISGFNKLDKIADAELQSSSGEISNHQSMFGHVVSPVVQRLRNISNVDAAYTTNIYRALFGSLGVSCVNKDLLSQLPIFVRCLLGYMQGIGNTTVRVPPLVIENPVDFGLDDDYDHGLTDEELCEVLDRTNASLNQVSVLAPNEDDYYSEDNEDDEEEAIVNVDVADEEAANEEGDLTFNGDDYDEYNATDEEERVCLISSPNGSVVIFPDEHPDDFVGHIS